MANAKRFIPLGPLLSGSGSRAFLGVEAHPSGPRPVVFIWAPDEVVRDPERLARLKRDTESAARLDHPNLISVIGFEELDEGSARVVAFADGESLRSVLETAKAAGRPLPPELGARVVADACFGVHYAHELGESEDGRALVHGDLRPEMLMVSFDGTTKVTGYGAIEVAPKPEAGKVTSRQRYQAPEQVAGGRSAAGRAADVYALGVILHEVLTGRPPFVDETDLELAILTKEPPRFSLVTAPEGLVDVTLRAMAKKANERYPTALALREAIEVALGSPAPSTKDVKEFLAPIFPVDGREREARRQLLASVISTSGLHVVPAEMEDAPPPAPVVAAAPPTPPVAPLSVAASVTTAPSPPAPAPASPQKPVEVSPPAVVVPAPLVSPSAPKRPDPVVRPPPAASARTYSDVEVPRSSGGMGRILLPVLVIAAIAIPLWIRSQVPSKPKEGPSTAKPSVPEPTPEPTPPPKVDRPPLAPTPTPTPPPPALPLKPAEPEVRTGTLELDAEPRGEIFLDGKSLGHAPVKATVPAGRHSVRLVDKNKGIDVARSVRVDAGKKVEERIVLSQASMEVTAPQGAAIFLDGRKQGSVGSEAMTLTFYEGPHRIQVTHNGAKVEKKFNARGGDKLTFNVTPTP